MERQARFLVVDDGQGLREGGRRVPQADHQLGLPRREGLELRRLVRMPVRKAIAVRGACAVGGIGDGNGNKNVVSITLLRPLNRS